MVKSVLVTGGAGFIGSHVVDELVGEGAQVRVLDTMPSPGNVEASPSYLNSEAEYVTGDVRDPVVVERCLGGVDSVVHLAAKVGLGVDLADMPDYVSSNDSGTAVLLSGMYGRGFGGRVVVASSMVVYGEGRYRCDTHGTVRPDPRATADLAAGRFDVVCPECEQPLIPESVPEDAALDPQNVYAATKLHQEHLLSVFSRNTGVPAVALRYHNVYGPRMPRDTPYAGVASIFRSALETGDRPRVFEDGCQLRDFVHVRDVAHATCLPLLMGEPVYGAFNVSSGIPHSVGEMAEALCEAFGGGIRPITTGEFRVGDVRHVFASPALAAERLGFRAQEEFSRGMQEFATAPLRSPVSLSGG